MKTTRRWRNYKPREDPDEELHHFRRLDTSGSADRIAQHIERSDL